VSYIWLRMGGGKSLWLKSGEEWGDIRKKSLARDKVGGIGGDIEIYGRRKRIYSKRDGMRRRIKDFA